jgi:polyphosphate glucokinase
VKGAVVDLADGRRLAPRVERSTPAPATPRAVAAVMLDIAHSLGWSGATGAAFPGVVQRGRIKDARKLDGAWRNLDLAELLAGLPGAPAALINDADAAGLAESTLGAGRDVAGTVLVLTFGTGIGSALIHDGRLVPNSELGELAGPDGASFESVAAGRNVTADRLDGAAWAARAQPFMAKLELLLTPALFVVGGGLCERFDEFFGRLRLDTPIVPAHFSNDAGIVGAALATL